VFDLPFPDQLSHGTGHVSHRDVWVNTMLVKEVDAVGLQALERLFGDQADAGGRAVEPGGSDAILEAELGCQNDLVAKGGDGLSEHFFIHSPVGFGAVEECDAAFERSADQCNGSRLLGCGAIAERQAHAAESDG
jgi:hypothetical protein